MSHSGVQAAFGARDYPRTMAQYGPDPHITGPNPQAPPTLAPRMRFLRNEPVTEPVPLADSLKRTPYRDPSILGPATNEGELYKALDIAVRVGELSLRCGASTRDVESSVVAVDRKSVV